MKRRSLTARLASAPDAPAPLPADKLANVSPDQTVGVVGESTIRWLGVGDWLLVDNLLIAPGELVSELPGDVAR